MRFKGGFRIFGLIIEAKISASYFYAGETIPIQQQAIRGEVGFSQEQRFNSEF